MVKLPQDQRTDRVKERSEVQGRDPFGIVYQIDWLRCDGCGLCAEVCPADIIVIDSFKAMVKARNYPLCFECGACKSVCKMDAISRI